MPITNAFLSNSPHPEVVNDVQILVIDNDQASRNLYAGLLENHATKVTALGSIKAAMDFLDNCIPAIVICEISFLDESVYPLIRKVRDLALSGGRMIPILVTSTFASTSLAQPLTVKVEAYLLKPIDIDYFIHKVWDLLLLWSSADRSGIPDRVMPQNIDKMLCSSAGIG